jgi:hypothetical protein
LCWLNRLQGDKTCTGPVLVPRRTPLRCFDYQPASGSRHRTADPRARFSPAESRPMTRRSPDSLEVVAVQNRRLIGAGVGRRAAAVIVDLVVMSPALFLVARVFGHSTMVVTPAGRTYNYTMDLSGLVFSPDNVHETGVSLDGGGAGRATRRTTCSPSKPRESKGGHALHGASKEARLVWSPLANRQVKSMIGVSDPFTLAALLLEDKGAVQGFRDPAHMARHNQERQRLGVRLARWNDSPRRSVGRCAEAQASTNRPTEAVKPCRKFFPPTGPISPAQLKPARGRPPSFSDTNEAS